MPHISITQLGAERLRAKAAEAVYWDRTSPASGFGLRVSPKGRKTRARSIVSPKVDIII
jgi:hypothetical protein